MFIPCIRYFHTRKKPHHEAFIVNTGRVETFLAVLLGFQINFAGTQSGK